MISNRCIAPIPNPTVFVFFSNSSNSKYATFKLRYRTRVNSTTTTIVFGFRTNGLDWLLDNIIIRDTITRLIVNRDGSFESNNLTAYYSLCNINTDPIYNGGEIESLWPSSAKYHYQTNAYQDTSFLLQSFTTVGERWYNVSFQVADYALPEKHFIFLMGS